MSTETEVKIRIDDCEAFCRRLGDLGAELAAARHFEDNLLLDFPEASLRATECLLRLREAAGTALLTYKGPPRAGGLYKVREELETTLGDGRVALEILGRLGLSVTFRYQKYRREYEIAEVRVAVDETPIGNYAELEGAEPAILRLARRLDIPETRFLRSSYMALYRDYCKQRGEAPKSMVF